MDLADFMLVAFGLLAAWFMLKRMPSRPTQNSMAASEENEERMPSM